mmetsp:Transcript_66631/g.74649  ORF Transcript_66631/g.74649 Transcript_66631/m.74649 type:complete len:119 (+) Transcript_66631:91-447(+)
MSCDSKSRRDLTINGQHVSLQRLHQIWLKARRKSGDHMIHEYKHLTADHFNKNASSRMRVFLAAQITPQQMIKLIHNFGDPDTDTDIILLLQHVDRFIDIMNGDNKKKNCDYTNSPDH